MISFCPGKEPLLLLEVIVEPRMCLLLEFKGFYADILKTTSLVVRVSCMALQWQTSFVMNLHCFCGEIPFVICQFGLLAFGFNAVLCYCLS